MRFSDDFYDDRLKNRLVEVGLHRFLDDTQHKELRLMGHVVLIEDYLLMFHKDHLLVPCF